MRMLVLARKYNDIFYAISTDEWQKCEEHFLLFITDRLQKDHYPLEESFDKIFTILAKGTALHILYQVHKIKKIIKHIDYDYITTSNLALTANLYMLSRRKTKDVILIEDGLMNYKDFHTSDDTKKKMLMKILGINEEDVQAKVSKSYMLMPESAKYYYGVLKPLLLDGKNVCKQLGIGQELEGKSIFVGQPVYMAHDITIKEYSDFVNRIIKEFDIDLYLPHTLSSNQEIINAKIFDITKSKATLELYASVYNFKIYSFNSSVLYSTKLINRNVETYSIEIKDVVKIPDGNIMRKMVNDILVYVK